MKRMKPHLRRVPATDIRRGDLIYLASERGLCRVLTVIDTSTICSSPKAIISYVVVGYGDVMAHSTHRSSAWKVVGWDNKLNLKPTYLADKMARKGNDLHEIQVSMGIPSGRLRAMSDKQLASLLDDVRNYPTETVDGIKGV